MILTQKTYLSMDTSRLYTCVVYIIEILYTWKGVMLKLDSQQVDTKVIQRKPCQLLGSLPLTL